MAPNKGATLASMVSYASDDDLDRDIEMLTPESQIENKQPAKRKAGRPKATTTVAASKITKSKVASRRLSGGSVLHATMAGAKKKGAARKVLAERTNVPEDGNDTEEVDDFEDAPPAKTKRGMKAAQEENALVKVKRGRKPKAADVEVEKALVQGRKKATATTKPKPTIGKRTASVLGNRIIPGSQPDYMDIEETEIPDTDETVIPAPEPVRPTVLRPTTGRAQSISRQPEILASRHRRGGSASDTERAGEPALRRKLGEITKKFENLDLKYRNLKELGTNESQTNFEKLRKSAGQRAKDQEDIITSLKKELLSQKSLATETKTLRARLETLQSENTRLTTENKSLTISLTTSQNEAKTLQAKLTTLRNAQSDAPAKQVPGSAAKQRGPASVAAGKKEEEEKIKIMQLKEELYSDLTGLMIHNVKRDETDDVYDCIQTGRNGTLRFHLYISHPSQNPSTTTTPGNTTSYEDEEFAYLPILDPKNDRHLIEILPDYLQEEISFPRNAAPKFYQKCARLMSEVFEE